ncbi:Adenylate cyclase type 10 [Chytridiales sp. JEL 0842]|nr:Adenylate cyclase type 10 [Chytridiales sp. JEL 0842]
MRLTIDTKARPIPDDAAEELDKATNTIILKPAPLNKIPQAPSPLLRRCLASYPRRLIANPKTRAEVVDSISKGRAYVQDGTCVVAMVDISGYSRLTSALSSLGKLSSEVITATVNNYMEQVVKVATRSQGDVVKYLGDALLISFPILDNEAEDKLARRVMLCILDICMNLSTLEIDLEKAAKNHAILHQPAKKPHESPYNSLSSTNVLGDLSNLSTATDDHKVVLSIHVAITAGEIQHVVMGVENLRMDYVIYGPCMEELGPLLDMTKKGELGFSKSVVGLFDRSIQRELKNLAFFQRDGSSWILKEKGSFEYLRNLLEYPTAGIHHPHQPDTAAAYEVQGIGDAKQHEEVDDTLELMKPEAYNLLRLFVNEAIVYKLESHAAEAIQYQTSSQLPTSLINLHRGEFRAVTIVFAKIPPPFEAAKAHNVFGAFVHCLKKFEGAIQQFAVDDKALLNVLLFWGLPQPWSHEKDALYALKAATEFEEKAQKVLGGTGKISISVGSGEMLYSLLGGKSSRWDASLLGELISVLRWTPKGRKESVPVYVVKPKNTQKGGVFLSLPLSPTSNVRRTSGGLEIGYVNERHILDIALDTYTKFNTPFCSDSIPDNSALVTAPRIIVVGGSGMGKSNLMVYFTQNLVRARIGYCLTQGTEIKQFQPYYAVQAILEHLLRRYLGEMFESDRGSNTLRRGTVRRLGTMNGMSWVPPDVPAGTPRSALNRNFTMTTPSRNSAYAASPLLTPQMNAEFSSEATQMKVLEQFLRDVGENPQLVPLLRDLLTYVTVSDTAHTKAMDGPTRRTYLSRLARNIIRWCLERDKSAIVVDDAQWVDPISLEIIDDLIYKCPEAMVVMFMRPLGENPLPVYEHIFNAPGLQQLEISGLQERDMEDVLVWKFGTFGVSKVAPAVISAVFEKCKGSPLVLDSLAESAKAQFWSLFNVDDKGILIFKEDDSASNLAPLGHLDNCILTQFDRLIRDATILGQYFDLEELCYAGQEYSQEDLADFIETSDTYHFLLPLYPDDPDCRAYYFRHLQIMETIYESLPYKHRLEMHELLAKHLETKLSPLNKELLIPAIAHNYRRTDRFDKQVEYLSQIGLFHCERAHVREAVHTLETLLEVVNADGLNVTIDPQTKAFWIINLVVQRSNLLMTAAEKDLVMQALSLIGEPWPKRESEIQWLAVREALKFVRLWRKTNGGMKPVPSSGDEVALQKNRQRAHICIMSYNSLSKLVGYVGVLSRQALALIAARMATSALTMGYVDKGRWLWILYFLAVGISWRSPLLSKILYNKAVEVEKTLPAGHEGDPMFDFNQSKALVLLVRGKITHSIQSCLAMINEQRSYFSSISTGYSYLVGALLFKADIQSYDLAMLEVSKTVSLDQWILLNGMVIRRLFSCDFSNAEILFEHQLEVMRNANYQPVYKSCQTVVQAWFSLAANKDHEMLDRFEETSHILLHLDEMYVGCSSVLLLVMALSSFIASHFRPKVEEQAGPWSVADRSRIAASFDRITKVVHFFGVRMQLDAFYWLAIHMNSLKLLLGGNSKKAIKLVLDELRKKDKKAILEELVYIKGIIYSTLGLYMTNDSDREYYYSEASHIFDHQSGFKYIADWLLACGKRRNI